MNPVSFWSTLPRPFFVLAPMADVTDAAFRRVIAARGRPDVMWTEFVSADGLCHPVGRERLLPDLLFTEAERPIVAQLFTSHPEKMLEAASLIQSLGFDGLDINMGCPDRAVEKQGAGAALIKNPARAREVLRAAQAGAPNLPISVKTRLGYHRDELDTWLPELLAERPAAVTIHARTRQEMSKVPARWEAITRAVAWRDQLSPSTLIIGNGDALSVTDARQKALATGADGVMLGRAIFGNPWLFAPERPLEVAERLATLVEHTTLFENLLGEVKNFAVMKKHFKSYLTGIPDGGELREALMQTTKASEVAEIVKSFLA